MSEVVLMRGNEALAEAAIRTGADVYFGYPITPQSEVMEYLASERPEKRTGMIILQAESEIAAINMVYGAAGAGCKVMISSSGPGISLMQEAISFIAGAQVPCLIVNFMRGGPGLGTIQASQGDYFQATRGGGHGDYRTVVLAPATVQEMVDFVSLGFDLAFAYRNPVLILADGMIGQMMEKIKLPPQQQRLSPEQIAEKYPWAVTGKKKNRKRNILNSVELNSEKQEQNNFTLIQKYNTIAEKETRYEEYMCDDADNIIVAFGSASRIGKKAIEIARSQGIKIGLVRPITLYPFPYTIIEHYAEKVKGMMVLEINSGQMVEDVRLAVNGKCKVAFYGRMGGIIPTPTEVLDVCKQKIL